MNVIFSLITILSIISLLFINPDGVLSAMLSGGEKALNLTLKLSVIYAVWLGIFAIAEKTDLTKKFAKILRPFNKLLLGDIPEKANDYFSLNVSANLLGFSGATTPMGIKAIRELEKYPNTEYAICVFFVINATSIQVIPSSVLALRVSLNSLNPSSIILPTILSTLISTIVGILLVKIFVRRKK